MSARSDRLAPLHHLCDASWFVPSGSKESNVVCLAVKFFTQNYRRDTFGGAREISRPRDTLREERGRYDA